MTEHSIEELGRQYNAAHSRLVAAQKAEEAALARLNAAEANAEMARLAEKGIVPGVRVRLSSKWGTIESGFFGGVQFNSRGSGSMATLYRVKRDGTPSKVHNLIPYYSLYPITLADDDDKQEARE